jgi:ATP/maltotriose-dependent transcriptional regulator MalT
MGETSARRPARRRRIIERPRLIRALDRSQARVRTLVAAAGYGKTILAEQWAARDVQRVAWYRARRSAIDVAVLARGLSAAAGELVPGAGRRLEERLAATQDPAREAGVLAEILADDLVDWPDDAWIALDDYHHVAQAPSSELFVETLVQRSPVRLLIASRSRPSWIAGRHILYGEVLEITQTALAMSADEVEEVFGGRHADLAPGLLAIADGWPAVIGLASVADAAPAPDLDVPEALYEFFADEVYRALDLPVRTGLAILGALPLADRELAAVFLGAERASVVCRDALALGVLDERDGRLELHPLAATFLEARARRDAGDELDRVAPLALECYRARREWDAAFEVVDRLGLEDQLEPVVAESLDELLNAGRLATLDAQVDLGRSRGVSSLLLRLAEGEVRLRQGRHVTASSIVNGVAADLQGETGRVASRLLALGGRAAHVGSREEEALAFYREAQRAAVGRVEEREALWGQVMCSAALEQPEAHDMLRLLEGSVQHGDPRELVRMVDKQISVGLRFGYVRHLADARQVAELLPEVEDPIARCSFRSMYAWALTLACDYSTAFQEASALIDDATEFRISVALPYGHATAAAALAGLKRYDEALDHTAQARVESRRCNDTNGEQNAYSIELRVLLQSGMAAAACAIEPPDLGAAVRWMKGEVLASRALALVTLGRVGEALRLALEAEAATNGIEAQTLARCVKAVAAIKARQPGMSDCVENMFDHAYRVGAVDPVVTAYRANADLLSLLLATPATTERTVFVLARAGDERLAELFGTTAVERLDPTTSLSRREREVYELVLLGLSNKEIGGRLFISESTVKVHVHHVFDKLGIRSRTALALGARTQAAPRASDGNDSAIIE